MTQDKTYNGWTNYATWRVNLEMIDGLDPREMGWQRLDVYDMAQALKDFADEIMCQGCGYEGLVLDYARAFLSDVNWQEIAKHMIEEYGLQEEEEAA